MSNTLTDGIRIEVTSEYLIEHSDPQNQHYVFAYHIKISNEGDETAQLLRRHWYITDALGKVEEVEGPGVIGQTPILSPGENFEYTSFCPLKTPIGSMHGSYQMKRNDGSFFNANIASFHLKANYTLH